jgi:hypothetical protein
VAGRLVPGGCTWWSAAALSSRSCWECRAGPRGPVGCSDSAARSGMVEFGPVVELVTRPGWFAGPLVALAGGGPAAPGLADEGGAGRRDRALPEHRRRAKATVVPAEHLRPAVVTALDDDVDLVAAGRAVEPARPMVGDYQSVAPGRPVESLGVAVPNGEHRRAARGAAATPTATACPGLRGVTGGERPGPWDIRETHRTRCRKRIKSTFALVVVLPSP